MRLSAAGRIGTQPDDDEELGRNFSETVWRGISLTGIVAQRERCINCGESFGLSVGLDVLRLQLN